MMRGLALLFIVISSLPLTAVVAEEPLRSRFNVQHPTLLGAEESVHRALDLSRARWAEALQTARSKEEQANALGHLGEIYLAHGFDEAAADALGYAIEIMPQKARWHYFYGIAQENSHQLRAAVDAYQAALKVASLDSTGLLEIQERLTALLLSTGQPELAKEVLLQRADEPPPTAYTHLLHARIAYTLGQYSQAQQRLEEVAALHSPTSVMAVPLRHVRRLNQQALPAVQLAGMDTAGGYSLQRHAPWSDSLAQWVRGVSHYLGIGQEHLDAGRFSEAHSAFETAVAIGPSRPDAQMAFARINEILGDLPRALQYYKNALGLNPEYAVGWYFIGAFFEREQDDASARQHYLKAIEIDAAYIAPRWMLAHSFMRAGDFAAAETHYEEVARLQPERSTAWYYVGLAGLAQTDCDQSVIALETAYQLNRHNSAAREALVRAIALCSRDPDRLSNARTMALRIEDQRPDAAAAVTLAMVYAALQEFDDAIVTQKQAVQRDGTDSIQLLDQLAQYQSHERAHLAWPLMHPIFAPPPLTPHHQP